MTDIIQEIEDYMDKIGEDYDSYGQALAHERAVDTLLPLLKKAIEQRDVFYIKYHLRTLHSDDSVEKKKKYLNSELLKLLGENHE